MSKSPPGRAEAPRDPSDIILITLETPSAAWGGDWDDDRPIEIGEMVAVSAVQASNLLKDVRELITNAFGGRMRRYERLLDHTMRMALARFRSELAAQGYDGAIGVRFAHPTVVQGGVELVVYGTGFRFRG